LSQPLPLSPQFPSLDGRLSVQRDRAADGGECSSQRHNFGRLLDRFTQGDRGQDTTKDAVTAPQDQRPRERCGTTDDSPRPAEDATDSDTDSMDAATTPAAPSHATGAAADPAKPAPDAGPAPSTSAPAPVAVEVQTIAPAVPVAPAPVAATPVAADATPAAVPAVSTVAAAVPAVAAATVAAANGPTPAAEAPAAPAAPKATGLPAEPVAEAAAPEAAAETFALTPIAQPAARARRTVVANGATQPAAKAAAATPAEKVATEITAPQGGRLPAARAEVDPSAAVANSNQAQPQARIVKVDGTAAAMDATTLAGAREERDTQSGADQAIANLTSIDSPRRTAALYHKVADAAKPGADTPTPADQISIRLVHAVAEGKRAIQMHLHPAELGSIDVKMQWQGDKLTAQFTVDRPETLQLLQREVPALERSLGQAGVNVDSGSLSFSLRQQQGNGKSGGEGFGQAAANAGLGDGGELAAGDETLGQVIRDGILSIRV
jgi:flagellar hook-length control protein FliK